MVYIPITDNAPLRAEESAERPLPFRELVPGDMGGQFSLTQFRNLINYLDQSSINHIGIGGGEPTAHDNFTDLMLLVAGSSSIKNIDLYTNANYYETYNEILFYLSKDSNFTPIISTPRPEEVGDEVVRHRRSNISELEMMPDVSIDLSVVIHEPEQELSHILSLINEFDIRKVRWSIPHHTEHDTPESLENYLQSLSGTVTDLLVQLSKHGVGHQPERGHLPTCAFDDEQLRKLSTYNTGIHNKPTPPRPVFLPDNTAAQSPDMINTNRVDIDGFDTVSEIHSHFVENIDSTYNGNPIFDKCRDCGAYNQYGRSCLLTSLQNDVNPIEQA